MPRVTPSAIPRKSENVPSVTISGGDLNRVISSRVQRSAQQADQQRKHDRDAGIGNPRIAPERRPSPRPTSPIIEPTERSIPPVMMIGVSTRRATRSRRLVS